MHSVGQFLTGHSPFSHKTFPVRPPLWQFMQRELAVQLRCSKRRCSPSSSSRTPSLTPSSTAQSSQSAGPSSELPPVLCTGRLQARHFTVPAGTLLSAHPYDATMCTLQ